MTKPKKDVTGEQYGRLTITGDAPYRSKDRRVYVVCQCGNTKDVLLGDLRRGDTTSCGCYLSEVITKHGGAATRLYKIYHGMLNRCYLPSMTSYESYGGRGITVCQNWRDSFENFQQWALSNGYTDTLSIERKDVDAPYEPGNCTWIPINEQQRNKRKITNTTSKYLGVSLCKQTGKWVVMVKVLGKQKNLGRYDDEIVAARVRDEYIRSTGLPNYKYNF